MTQRFITLLVVLLALPACVYAQTSSTSLTPTERRIVNAVDVRADDAVTFLQRVVDINSGTFNAAGVRRVASVFEAQLDSLGFVSRWTPTPPEMHRAGHLFAERRGGHGARVLLIGHLDTVYESDDAFQRFERINPATARGPGVLDCKGGDVALLFALIALRDAGVLDSAVVAVALMGDEEDVGRPNVLSRAPLTEIAKRTDVALAFEAAAGNMGGASPSRLGFAEWALRVTSATPFTQGSELRENPAFADALRIVRVVQAAFASDPGVQVYPLGVAVDTAARGRRENALVVQGGMRFMSHDELVRMQSLMSDIARKSERGESAGFVFGDEPYPGMAGKKENFALLASLDSVSRALGAGPVVAGDPRKRGGGDISFISEKVAGLDGLGPTGSGAHSPAEIVDLASLTLATRRAALLIYRLTHVVH